MSETIEPVLTRSRNRNKSAIATQGERGGIEYRSLTSPLDFYIAKRLIDANQYFAGKRLLGVWVKCVRSPYSQMAYGSREGDNVVIEHLPIGIFAVEYRNAMDAVKGDDARKVVHAVCIEDIAASRVLPSSSRRTAKRRGMEYLLAALDDLTKYFRHEDRKLSDIKNQL